jgi:hypothetical protein
MVFKGLKLVSLMVIVGLVATAVPRLVLAMLTVNVSSLGFILLPDSVPSLRLSAMEVMLKLPPLFSVKLPSVTLP